MTAARRPARRLARLVLLACATLLAPAPAAGVRAQTSIFFVTVEGSDETGDGSAARPWATLSHASETVLDAPNTLVVVGDGTYTNPVRIQRAFGSPVGFRAEKPYRVRLATGGETVLDLGGARNVTLAGFEVTRTGPGPAGAPLVRIGGSAAPTHEIQLRDMVIHDGQSGELLQIGPAAREVLVESSLFYNPGRTAGHMRVSSTESVQIAGNIFLNDFPAGDPGRASAGSAVVIGRAGPGSAASRAVVLDRNIFLNWQGASAGTFVALDGSSGFPAAEEVRIESNLFLGNSPLPLAAPLAVHGGRNVTFRANTVAGNLPASAFAAQLVRDSGVAANESVRFFNNIWSDPTGSMGNFASGARSTVTGLQNRNNLYWNGGAPIPEQGEALSWRTDPAALIGDPLLPAQREINLPVWDAQTHRFGGRAATLREAFEALAEYARPADGSPAIDHATGDQAPLIDLLGRPRGVPDIGALENHPLSGATRTPPPQRHVSYLPAARKGVR